MRKLFFIFCLIHCVAVAAQQQPVRALSVADVVQLSLENNFDIQLSRNDSALAALDYAFSRYNFYPRLNATGGVLFNDNNQRQTLADGTKRESNNIRSANNNASVNLAWTLFDGTRMFIARRRLNQLITLGELSIKAQVVNSVAQVMQLYYEIVRLEEQQKAIQEQITLSGERLKLAQYKFDIGTGTKQEVLQAQIDANAQQSLLLTGRAQIDKTKQQINNLLGLALTGDWTPSDTITVNNTLTLDTLQAGIEQYNPDLLRVRQGLNVAQLILEERRAERWPSLSFNSAYNFARNNNKKVINPFQPLFNQNQGFNYGFTATIPIFNGMAVRRNIAIAQLDIQFQNLQYRQSQAAVATALNTAYRDYLLFKEALRLEEQTLALVRENLFIARERYRLGVTTFLEMRTAEQNLAEAQSRIINARFNIKASEIELQRVRGDLVK